MDDLLNQGWYALRIAWSAAMTELGGAIIYVMALAGLLYLVWVFWTPEVKKRRG